MFETLSVTPPVPPPEPPKGDRDKGMRSNHKNQNVVNILYRNIVSSEDNATMQDRENEVHNSDHDESWDNELEGILDGIKVKDSNIGGYDCPQMILSKYEEKRIHRSWRRGVIVKLSGRRIWYKASETRLKQMWVRK
ncbi:unnamed protein product [Vicia faba]|uniref:Uncharacterized protein n=1 Tax=Vicia faba TaxID=3906 RepID=A0AAV1ARC0_VICFA|nr:unnamed protein product [Vicia faba]